jgi:hypothetical protein
VGALDVVSGRTGATTAVGNGMKREEVLYAKLTHDLSRVRG